jgi:hypothetical protein
MTIKSIFDQRDLVLKLVNTFTAPPGVTDGPTMTRHFTSCYIHNFLKVFNQHKDGILAELPSAIQAKALDEAKKLLKPPRSAMFEHNNLQAWRSK